MWKRFKLSFSIFFIQTFLNVVLILRGKYGEEADATHQSHNFDAALGGRDPRKNAVEKESDRLFDSFALLLLFGMSVSQSRNYFLSGVGLTLLLGMIVIQVSLSCQLFYQNQIYIDVIELKSSLQAAIAFQLSSLAVHGRLSSLQMIWISILHTMAYQINGMLIGSFHFHDLSPGMKVIGFGSFFGVGLSIGSLNHDLRSKGKIEMTTRDHLTYLGSSIISFLFWPSFLTGFSDGDKRHRIVLNVLLSMMGGMVAAFGVSSAIDVEDKFSTVS